MPVFVLKFVYAIVALFTGWRRDVSSGDRSEVGLVTRGDLSQPPTRWWNKWFLVKKWTKVAVMRIEVPNIVHVAYRDASMHVDFREQPLIGPREFAVRVGREDCEWFIVPRPDVTYVGAFTSGDHLVLIGYTTIDKLSTEFPDAILI